MVKAGKISKSERVVVISTAHGLRFVEMKVKYHQRELEFPSHHANQPVELPARLDAVKEALKKALESKREYRCRQSLFLRRETQAKAVREQRVCGGGRASRCRRLLIGARPGVRQPARGFVITE